VTFGESLPGEGVRQAVREHGFFVERDYAERTPTLKQVIPYTVVARGSEVLLMRRLSGSGETRLRDKLSIGVGGHINPEDAPAGAGDRDPIAAATRREIDEELVLEGTGDVRVLGILNDDSNPVGAVHVGWVQVLELEPGGEARIREEDVLEGRFVSRDELLTLQARGANLETWSALLVESLHDVLPQPVSVS
jgi:predicted NUDIX family phosphoesterase